MATEITALTHAPAATPVRISHLDLLPVLDIGLSKQRRDFMLEVMRDVFVEGTDYGTVPGSEKPCLMKPGAERLVSMFGLSPTFEEVRVVEDWTGREHGGEPLFYYAYRCRLTRNGFQLGEGIGSCNTWESKYRYRWVPEHDVPAHMDKSTLKRQGGRITEPDFAIEKAETIGKYGKPAAYWQAFKDAIANKTAVKGTREKKNGGGTMPTWSIDATVFRVPNSDTTDQVNTCQKMGQKRALIAAVLVATNASEFMTQDLEDLGPSIDVAFTVEDHKNTPKESPTESSTRRVAEEAKKADATKGEEKQLPEELVAMLKACASRKGIEDAMVALGDRALGLIDEAAGVALCNRILAEQGIKFNDVMGKVNTARKFIQAWYFELEAIAEAGKPKASEVKSEPVKSEPFKTTDADLPGELFEKGKDSTYDQ